MRVTFVAIPFLLGALGVSAAHARPHHANAWSNAGVQFQLTEHTDVSVNEELRVNLTENVVEELNTQLAIGHDAGKHLQLAAHYRLDVEGWDDTLFIDQRMGFDAQLRGNAGPVELAFRQRVQPELSSSSNDPFRVVMRTRLRARWSATEAIRPYVLVEPYLAVADPMWDRLRFDVGVNIPVWGLDISYRLDEPLSEPGAPHRHIITVGFTGTLDLAPSGR
jgi:hypothetical protein